MIDASLDDIPKNKIVLASTNLGKLEEMKAILHVYSDITAELLAPGDFGQGLSIEEDGQTYTENAVKKALAYSQFFSLISIADDSGLEVAQLDGRPGLHSARYSGLPGATDADRRRFLLDELKQHQRPWVASFHSTIAVATPDGRVFLGEGRCLGEIIPEERGLNGFGYDPIFLLREDRFNDFTMAELDMTQKNQVSHRARAVCAVLPALGKLLE